MKKNGFGAIFISLTFLFIDQARAREGPEFSFSFLGCYKKMELFLPKIERFSRVYGSDADLALSIAMYESCGNEGLVSHAGARGIMQVMPATQKEMGVSDNIEAGIKYLSHLKKIFGDSPSKIIAAYNGGPGAVKRDRLRLETIQYLQGVSLFYHLLKSYRKEIVQESSDLEIIEIQKNDTWQSLSTRFRVSILELRLYNPFLAHRGELEKGARVAVPKKARLNLQKDRSQFLYIARLGDVYHLVANAFGLSYKDFRNLNHILDYGAIIPGASVRVPVRPDLLPR